MGCCSGEPPSALLLLLPLLWWLFPRCSWRPHLYTEATVSSEIRSLQTPASQTLLLSHPAAAGDKLLLFWPHTHPEISHPEIQVLDTPENHLMMKSDLPVLVPSFWTHDKNSINEQCCSYSTQLRFSHLSVPRMKCLISSVPPGIRASKPHLSKLQLTGTLPAFQPRSACTVTHNKHICMGVMTDKPNKIHIRNLGKKKELPNVILGTYRKGMNTLLGSQQQSGECWSYKKGW